MRGRLGIGWCLGRGMRRPSHQGQTVSGRLLFDYLKLKAFFGRNLPSGGSSVFAGTGKLSFGWLQKHPSCNEVASPRSTGLPLSADRRAIKHVFPSSRFHRLILLQSPPVIWAAT